MGFQWTFKTSRDIDSVLRALARMTIREVTHGHTKLDKCRNDHEFNEQVVHKISLSFFGRLVIFDRLGVGRFSGTANYRNLSQSLANS